MSDTHLPPNWQPRLLHVLGANPASTEGVRLFNAWAQAEGGTARWNPLNTTLKLFGSTNYNSVGVQNYVRPTEGICALALTLVNGHYNGILGGLQSGTAAETVVQQHAAEFKTWGTNPATILGVLQS